jgi:hypothetical protein
MNQISWFRYWGRFLSGRRGSKVSKELKHNSHFTDADFSRCWMILEPAMVVEPSSSHGNSSSRRGAVDFGDHTI